jgi:membrane protease YdiL (CAAX protease family)
MGSDLYHTADRDVRLEAVVTSLGIVALAYGVGIVLASLGVSVAASAGYTLDSAPVVALALQYALLPAGFALVVAGYVASGGHDDLLDYRMPTVRDLGWIVAGFLALVVASTVLGEIITALGVESAQNQAIVRGRENPVLFLVLLPITLLFVAPGEELVFRGVVQGKFREAYGSLPAVVIASLLFGISHSGALAGSGQVTYLAVATILGLILGAIYEYTENLLVPIAVHAVWNSRIYLAEWLEIVHGVTLPV